MTFVVLIPIVVALLLLGPRLNEIFLVSVRDGRVLPVRGRVPAALLADLEDVVESAGVARATIRAVRGPDVPRLVVSGHGISPGLEQQLRNTFGIHPLAALHAATPVEHPNLGQRLGWAWLAWALARRGRAGHVGPRLGTIERAGSRPAGGRPRLRLLRGRRR